MEWFRNMNIGYSEAFEIHGSMVETWLASFEDEKARLIRSLLSENEVQVTEEKLRTLVSLWDFISTTPGQIIELLK